jgi:thiol-disulfide isomerase/thioredoxin
MSITWISDDRNEEWQGDFQLTQSLDIEVQSSRLRFLYSTSASNLRTALRISGVDLICMSLTESQQESHSFSCSHWGYARHRKTSASLQLPDPRTGKKVSLTDVKGDKATVVMVLSNHCPYVVLLKKTIASLISEYQPKGVGAVGICASSLDTHPQDGPELMASDADEAGYTFPYVFDESQDTAKVLSTQKLFCADQVTSGKW